MMLTLAESTTPGAKWSRQATWVAPSLPILTRATYLFMHGARQLCGTGLVST